MTKKRGRANRKEAGVQISGVSGGQVNLAMNDLHQENRTVDTGGGSYIEGNVETGGGDFVGRDQISNVYYSLEVDRLFQTIYAHLDRKDLPAAHREDLQADLKEVEQEVAKGDQVDEGFLARRLRNIQRMAPDILDVILASIVNPVAGGLLALRKIVEKMKAEATKIA
jgi:hypothetical protein